MLITNDAWSEKEKDVENLTREREHLNVVRAHAQKRRKESYCRVLTDPREKQNKKIPFFLVTMNLAQKN